MTEPIARYPKSELGSGGWLADFLGVGLVNTFGKVLIPEAADNRLSILIFHRILPEPDPLMPEEITVREFDRDIKLLSRRFNVLSLTEGLQRLRDGTLPPYALCLTFDDGYQDNFTVALPVLQTHGVPATFFVATGYLDGGRMWNDTLRETLRNWPLDSIDLRDWGIPTLPMASAADRRRTWLTVFKWMRRIGIKGRTELLQRLTAQLNGPLPDDLMLSSEQVRGLHQAGMEIGCHTVSHPILRRVGHDVARQEILTSRETLESLIQAPVRYFAYPNGVPGDDYSREHVDIVANCGFDAAFSTAWGVATTQSDPYQLPRFTPWDKSTARFALRFLLSRRQIDYPLAA